MNHKEVMAWVLSVCQRSLRKSQAKTLSVLVAAALVTVRASLANLGRNIQGDPTAKHKIKRVWRFIANERVEVHSALQSVWPQLLRQVRKGYKHKPLVVSFDWTDIRRTQTLLAAVVIQGRSVPLIWASCSKNVWEGHKSRNSFEEALLLMLRTLIPYSFEEALLLMLRTLIPPEWKTPIILLADRGFGRTELGRFCQRYGFHYVIRIQPKVRVQIDSAKTRLDLYPVKKGQCFKLPNVIYRADHHPLTQHVVVRWKKGLPKHRDEIWYLMTDLPQDARTLSDLYGKRMEIEEFFRDAKNKRHGWALRDTGLTDPDRLDRLLLVLALAYLFLVAWGLHARKHHRPGRWCSNQRSDSLSVFSLGQQAYRDLRLKLPRLLALLLATAQNVMAKWG
jgi:hypothetical protein